MAEQNHPLVAEWKQQLGARSEQQDACGISPADAFSTLGCLAVLADGMGGMEHGAVFSRVAVDAMLESFSASSNVESISDTLLSAYLHAREKALALRAKGMEGSSTVVAALVRDGYCAFLSVGDSRIYLLRSGCLLLLNREHTLGVALDEQAALGLISEAEAQNNMQRAALCNHIAQDPPRPVNRSLTPFQLMDGDRLLLVSDGVFRSVDDALLGALAGGSADSAMDDMLRAVAERNNPRQDNYSIVLLCYGSSRQDAEEVAECR